MKKMNAKKLIDFVKRQGVRVELSENAGFLRVSSVIHPAPSMVFVDLVRLHKNELLEFFQS